MIYADIYLNFMLVYKGIYQNTSVFKQEVYKFLISVPNQLSYTLGCMPPAQTA